MGSWIGGDRDGNPFVTAEVMHGTLRLQSSRVMQFYLEELHVLGSGGRAMAHLADVSDERAVNAMAQAALARFGRLDVLVNNAAIRDVTSIDEIGYAQWRPVRPASSSTERFSA
jgi:NAD(P)-dependent dehydrogenase (short-subunit alcohol dehydrogenase family)